MEKTENHQVNTFDRVARGSSNWEVTLESVIREVRELATWTSRERPSEPKESQVQGW